MNWFLVIYLYSTSDVLVKDFSDKQTCQSYLVSHQHLFIKEKDIKEIKCEQASLFQGQGPEIKTHYLEE